MAKLLFLSGELVGREAELVVGENPVGRTADNRVVINDPSVSRRHCVVLVHGREVIVREHGSHNGTFVADVRVEGQRFVAKGQVIRFGTVEARLVLSAADRVEESSTLSATHDYQAYLERERRRGESPALAGVPPRPAVVKPEPSTKVLAPEDLPAPRKVVRPEPASSTVKPAGPKRGRLILLGTCAAVLLVALTVWWLLHR